MALLLVLMIVAMLAALLTEFAFSTLVDLRLTETFRDSTRAYYLAKGGVTVGRVILQNDLNKDYDAKNEMWAQGLPNYPVGDGVVSIFIEDQDGKLDLNNLWDRNGKFVDRKKVRQVYELFSLLGLSEPENLVAALVDWVDEDDKAAEEIVLEPDNPSMPPIPITARGAESSYYQGLESSYTSQNGRFTSLEELLLIRGFTRETLKLVAPHLTVNGSTTINVNTASPQVMAAVIVGGTIASMADAENVAEIIAAHREVEPILKISDIKDIPGISSGDHLRISTPGLLAVTSDTYRIKTEGGIGDGVRRIESFVKRDRTQGTTKLLYIKVN
jgi:general secretion pathway protein K